MVRTYTDKKGDDFYKRLDKYKAALARLRDMQAEAEKPENRYFCRCYNGVDIPGETPVAREAAVLDRFRSLFAPIHEKIFPNGAAQPEPINPRTYFGMELIYRTLVNHATCKPLAKTVRSESDMPKRPQDGYIRWEPDGEPRNTPICQKLQAHVARETRKLQARKDKGYASFAPVCERCPKLSAAREIDSIDAHWGPYIAKWRETIRAYEAGDIDWPENAPAIFQIMPRSGRL